MIKINLGSGVYLLPGFTNVDMYEKTEVHGKAKYVKADVRNLPMKTGTVDYALASQVLEHLPMKDVEGAIKEWVRILKKGGRLVITCPDFNQQCEEWLETPFSIGGHKYLAEGIWGNQLSEGEYHRAPITPQLLQHYLKGIGVDGKMFVIKKGEPMRIYPGYGEKDRVYRFGEVHIDCIKL